MLLNKNNFTINGKKVADYITKIKFGYHKEWGSDSGRNMAKAVTGSFDIFVKFTLTFRDLEQDEIELWSGIINSASQTVNYYDPDLKKQNTESTYTGNLEYVQENLGYVDGFDVSFIGRVPR